MTKKEIIAYVSAAWSKWNETKTKGRDHFKIALFKENRDLFRALQRQPKLIDELPLSVKQDFKKREREVSAQALKELMPMITRAYKRRTDREQKFQDFVDELILNHRTAKKLREFLQNNAGI